MESPKHIPGKHGRERIGPIVNSDLAEPELDREATGPNELMGDEGGGGTSGGGTPFSSSGARHDKPRPPKSSARR